MGLVVVSPCASRSASVIERYTYFEPDIRTPHVRTDLYFQLISHCPLSHLVHTVRELLFLGDTHAVRTNYLVRVNDEDGSLHAPLFLFRYISVAVYLYNPKCYGLSSRMRLCGVVHIPEWNW